MTFSGDTGRSTGLRRRATLVALALAVASAGACSESNRTDDRPEPVPTAAADRETTSTSFDREREEVTAAFIAAADAFNEAASGPDTEYPLEATHAGPMLEQSRTIVEGLDADGLVLEYPSDSRRSQDVLSVEFRGRDVALLEVCTVDDGQRVRQDSGEVVAGGGLSTVWADVAMERHDGVWKLAERRETDRRNGEAACDGRP